MHMLRITMWMLFIFGIPVMVVTPILIVIGSLLSEFTSIGVTGVGFDSILFMSMIIGFACVFIIDTRIFKSDENNIISDNEGWIATNDNP